jgi:hypothetical protein
MYSRKISYPSRYPTPSRCWISNLSHRCWAFLSLENLTSLHMSNTSKVLDIFISPRCWTSLLHLFTLHYRYLFLCQVVSICPTTLSLASLSICPTPSRCWTSNLSHRCWTFFISRTGAGNLIFTNPPPLSQSLPRSGCLHMSNNFISRLSVHMSNTSEVLDI